MKNLSKIKTTLAVAMLLSGSAFSMDAGPVSADDLVPAMSLPAPKIGGAAGVRVLPSSTPNFDIIIEGNSKDFQNAFSPATWDAVVSNDDLRESVATILAQATAKDRAENTLKVLRDNFSRQHSSCNMKASHFMYRDDAQFLYELTASSANVENPQDASVATALFKRDTAKASEYLLANFAEKLTRDSAKATRAVMRAGAAVRSALNAHAASEEFDSALGIKCCDKQLDQVTVKFGAACYDGFDLQTLRTALKNTSHPSLIIAKQKEQELSARESFLASLQTSLTAVQADLVQAKATTVTAETAVVTAKKTREDSIITTNQAREMAREVSFASYRALKLSGNNAEIVEAARHSACGDKYSDYAKTGHALVGIAKAQNESVDAFASEMHVKGFEAMLLSDASRKVAVAKRQYAQMVASFKQSLFASDDSRVSTAYLLELTNGNVKEAKNVLLTEVGALQSTIHKMSADEAKEDAAAAAVNLDARLTQVENRTLMDMVKATFKSN